MSASHKKPTAPADLRAVLGLGLGAGLPEALTRQVEGELEVFAAHMRHGLLAAAINVGLDVFCELLAIEVTEVAGAKGRHDPTRRALRHGSERSKVPLGGRMVAVDKPRVRSTDGRGEISLPSWQAVASRELLDRHALISMLTGVSTRRYHSVLEPVGPKIEGASSTSKSAISRRFVEATRARLCEFRSRPLGERRFLVVYIDGFNFAGETLVGALGVDETGNKVPLSVVHGTTENKTVCKRLLDDLEDRGFDPSSGVLFVIDGGKAIYHALMDKWSDLVLVQRCRAHKQRNIIDLLPDTHHAWVIRELHRAWAIAEEGGAERSLHALADKIERTHPDAPASFREGLCDTVTINRLGISGTLARTLATTNTMESTVDIVKMHAMNVKRWMPGDMRLRWAAVAMLCAEAQYRRVKGYRQLDHLTASITAQIERRTAELSRAS
ncbi:MAG: IS256 family transposase [Acidimicrobiales bacterium]